MVQHQLQIFTVPQQRSIYICSLHTKTPEDNGMPRATGWGICWWGTKHFSQEIMNIELQDIHSFNLYLDSTRDKHRASSHFQVCPVCMVTVKNCAMVGKMDASVKKEECVIWLNQRCNHKKNANGMYSIVKSFLQKRYIYSDTYLQFSWLVKSRLFQLNYCTYCA